MRDYEKEYKEAQKAGEVATITPSYVEFEKDGDTVIGLLKGKSTVESSKDQGSYYQYMVETSKGMVKFAMGRATDREIEPMLRVNHLYAFTFEGKVKLTGGRSVNKFKVVECLRHIGEDDLPDDDIPF